jgi:L-lactate dehydrogenase complex protein LldF
MGDKTGFDFKRNIDGALKDGQLRKNLRKAMDILVDKRKHRFRRRRTISKQLRAAQATPSNAGPSKSCPSCWKSWKPTARPNGIQVHWAEDTAQANRIFLDIMHRHEARPWSRANRWCPKRCT